MKYFLSFLLIFCLSCIEQKSNFVQSQVIPSKIDSLETEVEIQSFVQKLQYPYYRYRDHDDSIKTHKTFEKFELKKIKDFDRDHRKDFDSLTKILADSIGVTNSFYKADIDNNGFTDLVIIGDDKSCTGAVPFEPNSTIYCDFSVYALMNFGNDSINPVNLMRLDFSGDAVVPKLYERNGKISLKIYEAPKYSWFENEKISDLKITELTYKHGTFVEKNHTPKIYKIEKIEYQTEPCYGNCPIFELTINNDRTAFLNAIEYNSLEPNLWEYEISRELKGKFKAIITDEKYQEIIDLLNYLDFPTLENDYWLSATDMSGSKLKVTYNKGKTKTITDYGKKGTLGLIKVYDLIENLRTNQEWK